MKHLILLLLFLAPLASCRTNPATGEREVDVQAVRTELELLWSDLDDTMALVAADRPELAEGLQKARDAAGVVGEALDDYIAQSGPDTKASLVRALAVGVERADELIAVFSSEDRASSDARLALFAAKIVMRRVAYYLDEPEIVPAP